MNVNFSFRYGRKKVLFGMVSLQAVAGFLLAWAPEQMSLCAASLLLGVSGVAAYTLVFIIGMCLQRRQKFRKTFVYT